MQLIGDEKLTPLLSEKEKQGVNSKERAEEIARALKADFAVFGSLTSIGPGFSLDLSVLELGKEESKVTRISEAVPEDQLIPKLSDMVYNIRAVIAGVDIRPQRREEAEADAKNKSIIGLFYPPGAEDKATEACREDVRRDGAHGLRRGGPRWRWTGRSGRYGQEKASGFCEKRKTGPERHPRSFHG